MSQPVGSEGAASQTIPRQLGDYELLERLGGAQTGPVFKAQHRTSGHMFAVKVLPPDLAKNENVLKRFQREAALAMKLNHPNLIVAFDYGQQADVAYLVMEYFTGQDLAKIVRERGPLPLEEVEEYLLQIAEGLAYLHSQGVVHRNVKPHNLLVGGRGNVKIANLLTARIEDGSLLHGEDVSIEELTRTGQVIGSVDYLSPEQARDSSRIDARADIYALGCTLHFLLTGKPPFQRKNPMQTIMAHAGETPPSLKAARPDVSDELERLYQQMMEKDPNKRLQSMQRCLRVLNPPNHAAQLARWAIPAAIALVIGGLLYVALR